MEVSLHYYILMVKVNFYSLQQAGRQCKLNYQEINFISAGENHGSTSSHQTQLGCAVCDWKHWLKLSHVHYTYYCTLLHNDLAWSLCYLLQ